LRRHGSDIGPGSVAAVAAFGSLVDTRRGAGVGGSQQTLRQAAAEERRHFIASKRLIIIVMVVSAHFEG